MPWLEQEGAMKGKVAALVIVALIALLIVSPSLAAGPRGGHGAHSGRNGARHGGGGKDLSFKLYGTIEGLNSDAGTIAVKVETPDRLAGETLTIQTTGDTRFRECDPEAEQSQPITFEDLKEGSYVRVAGTVEDGVYVAGRVIQYVSEP
jgi:hypothetical protein